MISTLRFVLYNYRGAMYFMFVMGAIWGASLSLGIRMWIDEMKHDQASKKHNKEI